MKILFLSPHKHLVQFLQSNGDEVIQSVEPVSEDMIVGIDFIISYGYRRKIERSILSKFPRRAINLHIAFLPYNRGADPNLWSFLEDTPKGVAIHYLDGNIDTGDLIVRQEVEFDLENDTLRTSYRHLSETIEALFYRHWLEIRDGKIHALPQLTFHRVADKDKYHSILEKGWDTPIKDIIGKAK